MYSQVTATLNDKALERLKECAEIHRYLHDHSSILNVYGVHIHEDPAISTRKIFSLLLEKAEGSLRDIIRDKDGPLRQKLLQKMDMRDVIGQVFDGLTYIHSNKYMDKDRIAHRDIKPENILVTLQKRDGSYIIKFTDFDSAKQLDKEQMVEITKDAFTGLYLDPALRAKIEQGEQVLINDYLAHDVYATALVMYELLGNGEHLYKIGSKTTFTNMEINDRTNLINAEIDEFAKNLIWTMTQPKIEDRVTMQEAKKTPFFLSHHDHIQALNALNEAMIELGDSDKAKAIKDELNENFFMVLDKKWKELPIAIPEI